MGREGWIYALAFAVVLGGGALLIAPRLQRLRGAAPSVAAPPEAPSATFGPSPRREAPWLGVEIRGAAGRLKGPARDVEGAEVRWLTPRDATAVRLELRPTAAEIAFGAAGHEWRVVEAASLAAGAGIVLAEAAPAIIVRVREPAGGPAADVPVDVLPRRGGPGLRTDGGGTVVIDDVPAGLVVVSVGGRERRGPTLRLLAGRDRDVEAVLDPVWEVRGRVLALDGRAVSGARVEGIGSSGTVGAETATDGDGRFLWRGPLLASLSLRVTRPGIAIGHAKVHAPDRGPLATDVGVLRLGEPSARLEGRVLSGATGGATLRVEPAVAAPLRELFGPSSVLVAPTVVELDEDGDFLLPDLPSGVPLRVSIRGGGLPLDDVLELSPGERVVREYTPPPGYVLAGTVRDARTGRPAVGVRLRVSAEPRVVDHTLPGDREGVTDGAGRFRVDGLPRGAVYVRAFVAECRTLLGEATLPRSAGFDLTLKARSGAPERRLEGAVLDDRGTPLVGVTVRAAGRSTVTDADGAFRLDDVEAFDVEVDVVASYLPGTAPPPADPTPYVAGSRRRVRIGGDPLRLVLTRGTTLVFRALDGVDDVPLSALHVLLRTQDGQVIVDRIVAPVDGRVRLDGLLPDGSSLALFARRHRWLDNVVLTPDEPRDLGTVRLARGTHIQGRVVDATGAPIVGARLGGVEPGWLQRRGVDPAIDRELAFRHTTTDAEGRFVFDGFDPKKPATLACWAPDYAPAGRRVILEHFKDSVQATLDVELRRGGYLAVELLEAGTDRPVQGAFLDLEDARTGSDYLDLLRRSMIDGPVGSDDDWRRASEHFLMERTAGHYKLGPALPGPYQVWVDRPGFRAIKRQLSILDPVDALLSMSDGTSRSLTETLSLTWEMEPGR